MTRCWVGISLLVIVSLSCGGSRLKEIKIEEQTQPSSGNEARTEQEIKRGEIPSECEILRTQTLLKHFANARKGVSLSEMRDEITTSDPLPGIANATIYVGNETFSACKGEELFDVCYSATLTEVSCPNGVSNDAVQNTSFLFDELPRSCRVLTPVPDFNICWFEFSGWKGINDLRHGEVIADCLETTIHYFSSWAIDAGREPPTHIWVREETFLVAAEYFMEKKVATVLDYEVLVSPVACQ